MYNNVYILNKDNLYWTCIGNEEEYSKNYRRNAPERYNLGAGWVEIGMIPTDSEEEAKELQLKINTIFKPFITVNSMINIIMNKDLFLSFAICIRYTDNDHLLCYLNAIVNQYKRIKKSGYVYFVECANDKYKIGCTTDFDRRWQSLQKEDQNQAINIIDKFETNDMYKDEAVLQCKCHKYKANSNKGTKCTQEVGNSELYMKCKEVEMIWYDYIKELQ